MHSLAAVGLGALVLGSCAPDLSLELKSAPVSAGDAGAAALGAAGASDGGDRGTCLTCANCTGPADCAHSATQLICNTVIDTLGGLCVACLKDTDCTNKPGYVCDPVTLQCVATCTVANDPACGNQGRTCDPSIGKCVECLDGSDCPDETPICNHECVECVKAADCKTPKHCWLQRHSCVDCLIDADCATGNVCSGKHLCIPLP